MTPTTGAPVAVLDANVLYPQWLRDVMLTLAAEGSFQPAWSRQIIDEMRRNVLRNHPEIDPDRFDAVTVGTLQRAFPDAWTEVPDDLIARVEFFHDWVTNGKPFAYWISSFFFPQGFLTSVCTKMLTNKDELYPAER